MQIGSLIEVSLRGTSEKAQRLFLTTLASRMVALLDEPILLVNDREVGEYLDGFMPSRV